MLILNKLAQKVSFPAYDPFKDTPELRGLGQPLAEVWPKDEPEVLDLVLGQDYVNQIWTGVPEVTSRFGARGPTGTPSRFGLIIQGAVPDSSTPAALACGAVSGESGGDNNSKNKDPPLVVPKTRPPAAVKLREVPPLEQLLREMLDLEYVGITEPKFEKPMTAREEFAVNYLEENLVYLEDMKRFQVKIPFDPDLPPLENNFNAALKRLQGLKESLSRSPAKSKLYHEAMQKYLANNHAEEVSAKDEEAKEIFYLPHHGVMKMTAEGKTN